MSSPRSWAQSVHELSWARARTIPGRTTKSLSSTRTPFSRVMRYFSLLARLTGVCRKERERRGKVPFLRFVSSNTLSLLHNDERHWNREENHLIFEMAWFMGTPLAPNQIPELGVCQGKISFQQRGRHAATRKCPKYVWGNAKKCCRLCFGLAQVIWSVRCSVTLGCSTRRWLLATVTFDFDSGTRKKEKIFNSCREVCEKMMKWLAVYSMSFG